MLMVSRDKYRGDTDVAKRLSQDGIEEGVSGKIAALFLESVFHSREIVEDDGFQDKDLYVYFGNDSQEDIDRKLDKRVDEAAMNGLSDAVVRRLKESNDKYKQILRLRLRTGGPAKDPPMKIELDPIRPPVM